MKATNSWTNLEIARLLRKMAAVYTILGENRFKIIAYDNAATAVEHATSELKDLWEQGELDKVPGVGPAIQSHLDMLFRTGKSRHFNAVLGKVNPAVFALLEIPGIGPKKAQKLVEILNIKSTQDSISELEKAAKGHKIASIPTFGEKSETDILDNIVRHKKGAIKEKRMVLPLADTLANDIISYLQGALGKKARRIDKLGSLRRQVATIGDIDLAVATVSPKEVIKTFIAYPKKTGLIEEGPTGASILLASGRQADLRVSKPESYGAMLQYFTGSKYHNIRLRDFSLKKGYSLSEYGIKNVRGKVAKIKVFATEEDFYSFLGIDYIEPELREDNGEIEAALHHKLPKLVELKDIRGDLQLHSDFDLETSHDPGENSIKEIQVEAKKMGYDYIGITDHNPSSKRTQEQIVGKLTKQSKEIEQINRSTKGLRVLSLLEVDILPSGELAVPQKGLDQLDGCLVSIHSGFNLGKKEMTQRILKGLSNPTAKILAHPTGRILGERDGYDLDWEVIFKFCKEHDKAIEINCYPNRLDLPDTLVREAVKRGVLLSLGTDSHTISEMTNMIYGVSVARRGWAEKRNIINCWDYQKLISWLKRR